LQVPPRRPVGATRRNQGHGVASLDTHDIAASLVKAAPRELSLEDGSRVAVVGGGPAGTFFAYFLLRLAESVGLEIGIDIYEPRLFTHRGPAGCNHCGGIVSESLVQLLASEGINLPTEVVERGIEAYMLHMDVGSVRIRTPSEEKRIAGVFRGNGPRGSERSLRVGFDRYLLDLAASSGAQVVRSLVTRVGWHEDRPEIEHGSGKRASYDLVALAAGVNSQLLQNGCEAAPGYSFPGTLTTFISEFHLGQAAIQASLGDAMHIFLLDLPRLEFAALIPKGDYVTLCVLGHDVDEKLVDAFLAAPEVKRCFPDGKVPELVCHCFPRLNVRPPAQPYADRLVWIGDCGVARLYKDGIGSAYRMAKAAARTVAFHGVSAQDFATHYAPTCKAMNWDNTLARLVFMSTTAIQKLRPLRRGVLRMTATEQANRAQFHHMSSVLWDVFTGSAPYQDVLVRSCHPGFIASLTWNLVAGNVAALAGKQQESRP
jgi:flavin-dependent dehydrogenase